MKKARKKRIVRRKRRISEREIMRIKRKLKKSARKLRLGAKRTGAYVYGTLRRIVGNPAIPAHMGNPDFVREFRVAEMRARLSGEPVGLYAYQTKSGWNFITRKQSMYRPPGEELVVLFGEKRGLRGNPYPTGGMTPLERLRYHVSGAIARGEATPIAGKPRRRMVRVLGYDVVEGSKKHMRLLAQKRHFDDLQRGERGLRGNPGRLFPASYPPEKKLILFLARREGWKKYKVSRTGTYPFELRIDGVGKNDIQFSGLLKLIAIHSLVNWTSPQVAMMSSYPSMAREGDWSGIRDSSDEAIDNIFYNFVLKPLGIARPISR